MTDEMVRAQFEEKVLASGFYEWPEFACFVRALLDLDGVDETTAAYKAIAREHGNVPIDSPRRINSRDVRVVLGLPESE